MTNGGIISSFTVSVSALASTAIEAGQIEVNARVAESLYRKATGEGRESVTAAIFWLNKTRAGWEGVEHNSQPSIVQIQRLAADLCVPSRAR